MRRHLLFFGLALFLFSAAACNKNSGANPDDAAIRAAVQKYLSGRPGLNVSAMDVNVKQVSIAGNTAQARVEFKAKGSGAGMEMTYNLERQGNTWVVKTSQNTGGLNHPPTDQGTSPAAGGELPAGHPPITAPQQPSGTLPAGHPPITEPGKTSSPPKKN